MRLIILLLFVPMLGIGQTVTFDDLVSMSLMTDSEISKELKSKGFIKSKKDKLINADQVWKSDRSEYASRCYRIDNVMYFTTYKISDMEAEFNKYFKPFEYYEWTEQAGDYETTYYRSGYMEIEDKIWTNSFRSFTFAYK